MATSDLLRRSVCFANSRKLRRDTTELVTFKQRADDTGSICPPLLAPLRSRGQAPASSQIGRHSLFIMLWMCPCLPWWGVSPPESRSTHLVMKYYEREAYRLQTLDVRVTIFHTDVNDKDVCTISSPNVVVAVCALMLGGCPAIPFFSSRRAPQ